MPFVKLDCGILNSTLWFEREAREVFITALLMAEPYELTEPAPQIEVNSLTLTGWSVPPGWYGFVPAAGVGIIHRAGVSEDVGRAALVTLGSPEVSSRSPEYDGRRLVRVDGGYIVLNYIKYRERDATTADRSRRWRERQKEKASRVSGGVTRVIRHQAEVQVQGSSLPTDPISLEGTDLVHVPGGTALAVTTVKPEALFDLWNETVTRLPKATKLSADRRRHLLSRLKEEPSLTIWRNAIVRLDASDFATGQAGGWRADFDFLLRPGTLLKVLEGKYDNRTPLMGAGKTAGNMAALKMVLEQNRGTDALDR